MPTIFETLSDQFYIAFFEGDPDKRRISIEDWIKQATPLVQAEVEKELRSYLEYILEATWTKEGWQYRVKKFGGTTSDLSERHGKDIPFIDGYRLRLDLSISHPWKQPRGQEVQVVGRVSPEAHSATFKIAQRILSQIDPYKATNTIVSQTQHIENTEGDDDYGEDGGRSPNDDRSDSMNPNNDSYHSAADNHSNQMNPNNDSYWSSRGR